MVVRLDGRGFTKFCEALELEKPNDARALKLMNKAAKEVMGNFTEVVLGFGESDEFSFVFRKNAKLFNRREDKILSCVLSLFSSAYVFYYSKYFPDRPLKQIPSFDARIVLYPSIEDLKAYLSWRQVDTHINNLYNTTFWALIKQGNLTTTEAHKRLKGTFSKDKHEMLFTEFGINYNDVEPIFRRGSILLRQQVLPKAEEAQDKEEQIEESKAEDGKPVDLKEKYRAKNAAKKVAHKIIRVHDDLVEKEEFYNKYGLNEKLLS